MERDKAWLLPAIVIAVATTMWAETFSYVTGYSSRPNSLTSLKVAIAIVVVTAFFRFLYSLFGLWRAGEDRPIARIAADFPQAIRTMAPIVVGIAIIGTFLYSTTFLKSMIPAVIPFWADPLFAASDRAIFIDAQAIAIALAPALPGIGLFYGLWHAAHLGGILWVLHWRNGNKARHILSFMLTWSVGMVAAYLFSSMGPIFTGGYDPSIAPAITQKAAAFLWSNYEASGARIGGGISAFPSMHVAIAAWLSLVLKDRGLTWLGVTYLMGIFAGSVILGWHYVIDGVAGVAIALVADRLSQAWLRSKRATLLSLSRPAAASN